MMLEELLHTHPDAWELNHWQWLLSGEFEDEETLHLLAILTPEVCGSASMKHLLLAMKPHQRAVPAWPFTALVDVCGTGGSGQVHFNTSTTVAMVLGGMHLSVAKFGNRAVTSASGSFDFLEALEIYAVGKLDRTADALGFTNTAFVFAPDVYPTLKRLSELRQRLKQKTLFNYVGPLLNPYPIAFRVLGCSHERMQEQLAHVLLHTPSLKKAVVFRSHCGLDEWHPEHAAEALWCTAEAHEPEQERLPALAAADSFNRDEVSDSLTNAKRFWELANGWDAESLAYHQVVCNAALGLHLYHEGLALHEARHEVMQFLRCKGLLNQYKALYNVYKK
jgi:anthranilate phosphoribosyltransferase